jgi:hypothetical protein
MLQDAIFDEYIVAHFLGWSPPNPKLEPRNLHPNYIMASKFLTLKPSTEIMTPQPYALKPSDPKQNL